MSPIQWKADTKLLKKQLLDIFCWYFISVASVQNLSYWFILALPIGTPIFWYLCVVSPLNLFWYSFIEIWFTCHKLFFQPLMIKIKPIFCSFLLSLEVIFFVLSFCFYIIWLPSSYHNRLFIPPLFQSFFKVVLTSLVMFWEFFLFFTMV